MAGFSTVSNAHGFPFYEMHEFCEMFSRTFRSLEEQLYLNKAQMKRQERQHAALLIPGRNVELVKVPTVEEFPILDSLREEFKQECFVSARCSKTPAEAESELQAMKDSLLVGGKTEIVIKSESAMNDEDFLEGEAVIKKRFRNF